MKKIELQGEIFKEITWTDGRYYVSNYGRVMSVGGKRQVNKLNKKTIMGTQLNNNGYLFVKLFYNGKHNTFTVHKLVMTIFKGYEDKLDINHIDGDKTNNRLDNLEYCTRKENMEHCAVNGLRKDIKKVMALLNGKVVEKGNFSRELAEKMMENNLISKDTNVETFSRQIRMKVDKNKPYKGFKFISIENL